MTVKELIKELVNYPPEMEVIYRYVGDYNIDNEILRVREEVDKALRPGTDKVVVIS